MSTLIFILQALLAFMVTPAPLGCKPMHLDPPVATMTSPIMMSSDLGQTWMEMGASIPAKVRPISFNAVNDEYFMGSTKGIYRGAPLLPVIKWEKELQDQNEIIGIIPGKIGPYAISLWNGFYQYDPISGSWVPMHSKLKDKNVQAVLERDAGEIVIGTGSGIYQTTDHGKSWKQTLTSVSVDRLAEHHNIVIACGKNGLYRSEDGGATWSRNTVAVGHPFFINHIGDRWITIVEGQEIAGIRTPNMVFQSTDDGKTWESFPYELPGALGQTYELRQIGNYLFGSGGDGLYKSADQGKTWEPVIKLPSNRGGFLKTTEADQKIFILYIEGC